MSNFKLKCPILNVKSKIGHYCQKSDICVQNQTHVSKIRLLCPNQTLLFKIRHYGPKSDSIALPNNDSFSDVKHPLPTYRKLLI